MKMTILVSQLNDNNIFHFFAMEVKAVWDAYKEGVCTGLFLHFFDEFSQVHNWRLKVLQAIVPVYTNVNDILGKELKPLLIVGSIVDPWTFLKYEPSDHYINLAKQVKQFYGFNSRQLGTKVVLVTRTGSRVLYDLHSQRPLEDVFTERCLALNIPHKVVCFDNKSFLEQARDLEDCKIMIACHGAANTNLFMLPKNASLFEYNFRKHWYCDPVCDDHYEGRLKYTDRCDGKLTYRPYFHKADYHNLSQLFGIDYQELDIEYADKFNSRNPIGVGNVYILINKVLDSLPQKTACSFANML